MEGTSSDRQHAAELAVALSALKLYDTVIIVDDSGSMAGQRWNQAGQALQRLAEFAVRYDENGIDIHFLNSEETAEGVKGAAEVEKLFKRVCPSGRTPIGTTLRRVLGPYAARYEKNEHIKRVNYIIITDGEPNGDTAENEVENVIVEFARKLDTFNAISTQVGIQFVQIGTDARAHAFLEGLDNNLKNKHRIRDMVDTTTLTGTDASLDVVKALLGAVNRRIDGGTIVLG